MKTGSILHIFILFAIVAPRSHAADFYVRSGAAGSNNGSNWTNAWNELDQIVWSSVNAGDTIWLAGGNYNASLMVGAGGTANNPKYNKSGTSGSPIYIKRVRSTDAVPAAAAGWNSSFDSQVVSSNGFQWGSGQDGTGSYVTIDGRVDTGTSCGIKCGGVSMDTGNTGVILQYVDMAGPAGSAPYTFSADLCAFYAVTFSGRGTINSPTLRYSRMHGVPNAMKISLNGITVEYCKLYDVNVYNYADYHGNIVYTVNTTGTCIFRENEVWNWDSEGIMFKGPTQTWKITNNLFHDSVYGTSGVGRAVEAEDGPHTVYFYGNTMVNIWRGLNIADSGSFTSASQARNNIFWNCLTNGDNSMTDIDYCFTEKSSIAGTHSISSGSNPFASTTNYHIGSTVTAKSPTDKGAALASEFATDFDQTPRPQGGAWDIGAYEYAGTVAVVPPTNALTTIQVN